MNSVDFSSLALQANLLENLSTLGYKLMTPIQQLSLPAILSGKDVIAQSRTGSGKTAAFALGLLQKLNVKSFKTQSIVLCPTRELAGQVATEIRKLGRSIDNIKVLTLCGGAPFAPQISSLQHGVHIVVGTPGRIEEHLRKGTLTLEHINILVLDEADRMLDMGFQQTIDKIIQQMPRNRQSLLFSATYPDEIADIAKYIMRQPIIVTAPQAHEATTIVQYFYKINSTAERAGALRLLLAKHKANSTLVFCNTKLETQAVADELADYGFYALAIHGDLDQRQRDQTLIRFANHSISVLVATDVAARGLDIDDLDMVINFNIAHHPETHLHRIGRTGRAGRSGVACSLYSAREIHKLDALEWDIDQQKPLPNDSYLDKPIIKPLMSTLKIDGGKKQKLRPGDIVGALTGKGGISSAKIGKIDVVSNCSYVAINSALIKVALNKIQNGNIKGKSFRVRILS